VIINIENSSSRNKGIVLASLTSLQVNCKLGPFPKQSVTVP
jgi:hypothetical protein